MIKFGQGSAGVTQDGEALQSAAHITCYNIVMLNRETRAAAMFHVWEGGYNGFSESQQEDFDNFMKAFGPKVCIITEGTRSSPSYNLARDLANAGMDVVEVKKLDSGAARWNAHFDPKTRELTIDDEHGKLLYKGVPLPDYVDVPAAEKGLSDTERRIRRLQQFVDADTGELSEATIQQLDRLLKNTRCKDAWSKLDSVLLSDFVDKRAKAAGFDDYCDYFEADKTHFTSADPHGAEMVLRKIRGPSEKLTERFRKAGRDFRNVKITPEAVVALLQEHPAVIDQFIHTRSKAGQSIAAKPALGTAAP